MKLTADLFTYLLDVLLPLVVEGPQVIRLIEQLGQPKLAELFEISSPDMDPDRPVVVVLNVPLADRCLHHVPRLPVHVVSELKVPDDVWQDVSDKGEKTLLRLRHSLS